MSTSIADSSLREPHARTRVNALASVAVLAISLLALAVRLFGIAAPNITGDEWFTIRAAREGFLWYLDVTRTFEPNAPLHPYLFTVFSWLAGESEFALRFLSAIFGVLSVPAMFVLGRSLLGVPAGIFAGLLLAVNPYEIAQSQNGRCYALVVMLVIIATYLLVQALQCRAQRYWIGYALVSIAMMYTHYSTVFILAAHAFVVIGGSVFLVDWRRHILRSWLVSVCAFGVAVMPWLLHNGGVILSYRGFYPEPVTPLQVLQRTLVAYAAGQQQMGRVSYGLAALVAVLGIVGLIYIWRRNRTGAVIIGLGAGFPLCVAAAWFLFRPMFEERYLLVLAPAYMMLAALGLVAVWRINRAAGIAVALVIVLASGYGLRGYYAEAVQSRGDYRGLAHYVATMSQPGDVIVPTGYSVSEIFSYYYRGPVPVVLAADPAHTAEVVQDVLGKHPTGVWHLPYVDDPPDVTAREILSREGFAASGHWFNGVQGRYYAVGEPMSPRPIDAVWGGWAHLMEWTADTSVEPGQAFRIGFHWKALEQVDTDYKVSLRLHDQSGQMIAQLDREPVNDLVPTSEWGRGDDIIDNYALVVPFGTAPGTYRVEAVMYDPKGGNRLEVRVGQDAPKLALDLGTVDVTPITRPVPLAALGFDDVAYSLTPDLSLVNHSILPAEGKAGEDLTVALLWRAPVKPGTAYTARLELVDQQGTVVATTELPVGGDHPTTTWIASEAIRQYFRLPVAETARSGIYRLWLRLIDRQSEMVMQPDGVNGTVIELTQVNVTAPTRVLEAPTVPMPLKTRFGSAIQLLGYDLSTRTLEAGGRLTLTLYWHAIDKPDRSYTVFTHVLNAHQQVRGQKDQMPMGGERPTTSWIAGEYLVDRYELVIDPGADPGAYSLEIGLYSADTGARLPAYDETDRPIGDHVVIPGLTVAK